MVCLCSGCALCVNHLTHNQQISRSTLIGNIYFYQLFITFNRISFKNMELLVFHVAESFFWKAGFGRVCAAWKNVFPEIFVCSVYLWFSLKKCWYRIFFPSTPQILKVFLGRHEQIIIERVFMNCRMLYKMFVMFGRKPRKENLCVVRILLSI